MEICAKCFYNQSSTIATCKSASLLFSHSTMNYFRASWPKMTLGNTQKNDFDEKLCSWLYLCWEFTDDSSSSPRSCTLHTRKSTDGEKDAFATLSYKYKSYPERSHNFERKYHSAVMWSRDILFE